MKKRTFARLLLANLYVLALSAMIANPASADLIVDFESKGITAGGQQQIEVYLSSNSGNQDLYFYDLSFLLVPVSATTGTSVTFIDPMSEAFVLENDYVFFGNSLANGSPNTIFDVQTDDTIVLALDETGNSSNETIGSNRSLLSRLTVQHNLGGASGLDVGGDTFEIILGRTAIDGPFKLLDNNFNEVDVDFALGTRGFITVAAIPEPGTFAFSSLIALGVLPMRRRRG